MECEYRTYDFNQKIDLLLEAYCEGLYAMDPRTTFPFWDFHFAPLFSAPWINKIDFAIEKVVEKKIDITDLLKTLSGPSVPRKELIYSLFDMKVAQIDLKKRLKIVHFWFEVLDMFSQNDWLSKGSNRSDFLDDIEFILDSNGWINTTDSSGKPLGSLIIALHALSYCLYSDVFVHQCAECRGPYKLGPLTNGKDQVLIIRSWKGLSGTDFWKSYKGPAFDSLKIAAIYEDSDFYIDIYNHLSWRGVAPNKLIKYCIWIDDEIVILEGEQLYNLAESIGELTEKQFKIYKSIGFEGQKRLWVKQRNYQFQHFFKILGIPWEDPHMEKAVEGKKLVKDPYWDMSLPKNKLFQFFRLCLDPRIDNFYCDWEKIYKSIFD